MKKNKPGRKLPKKPSKRIAKIRANRTITAIEPKLGSLVAVRCPVCGDTRKVRADVRVDYFPRCEKDSTPMIPMMALAG